MKRQVRQHLKVTGIMLAGILTAILIVGSVIIVALSTEPLMIAGVVVATCLAAIYRDLYKLL